MSTIGNGKQTETMTYTKTSMLKMGDTSLLPCVWPHVWEYIKHQGRIGLETLSVKMHFTRPVRGSFGSVSLPTVKGIQGMENILRDYYFCCEKYLTVGGKDEVTFERELSYHWRGSICSVFDWTLKIYLMDEQKSPTT